MPHGRPSTTPSGRTTTTVAGLAAQCAAHRGDESATGSNPADTRRVVAATTQQDGRLLDACSAQAARAEQVQAARPCRRRGPFSAAMTTAIGRIDNPADVVRLVELHTDEAFQTGLTNLVRTKLTPRQPGQPGRSTSRPATAAAVAATAFVPAGTPRRPLPHRHPFVPHPSIQAWTTTAPADRSASDRPHSLVVVGHVQEDAAAPLPILALWPALRFGSACHRELRAVRS